MVQSMELHDHLRSDPFLECGNIHSFEKFHLQRSFMKDQHMQLLVNAFKLDLSDLANYDRFQTLKVSRLKLGCYQSWVEI